MWAMNKCSCIQNMHQTMLHSGKDTVPELSSEWVTRYVSNASLFLPPSLAHIFGTIIPLFNSAVWSCFTPVHPHWLPFCPISPPLIRLCVIDNDRQKMSVHIGALMPPWCQRCGSTPRSYILNLLTKPSCIVSLLSAESDAKVVGFHSLWLTHNTPQWPRVAHMHGQPKEGSQHNSGALKGGMNKEIAQREHSYCQIAANKSSMGQSPS